MSVVSTVIPPASILDVLFKCRMINAARNNWIERMNLHLLTFKEYEEKKMSEFGWIMLTVWHYHSLCSVVVTSGSWMISHTHDHPNSGYERGTGVFAASCKGSFEPFVTPAMYFKKDTCCNAPSVSVCLQSAFSRPHVYHQLCWQTVQRDSALRIHHRHHHHHICIIIMKFPVRLLGLQ